MSSNKRSIVTTILLACLLALVAGPAAALGLGQLRVLSQANEPLLAEIPIISNDPSELEQLQARLASPDTFRRIGLQPPQGVVAELRFAVALDAQGRPVVRVTSIEPIRQPMLTFLVEVDWGQGRLVREYSALLDAPNAVAAPVQPAIQAPVSAPDNRIVRPPQVPAAQAEAVPEQVPAPIPAAPESPAPAPAPAPAWQYTAPISTASSVPTTGPYTVRRGDTLMQIAASLQLEGDYGINQTMLALLRSNPEAFIHGNINLVKAGAVLQMPEQAELAQLDQAQAAALVRTQMRSWRESRKPKPQPVQSDVAATTPSDDTAAGASSGNQAGPADVRLEIVPPSGGDTPGTQSGVSAGGEGEMLRTQALQEELASRGAEVKELRARVAELESLQQKQQKLIELKDSKLATVEQNLANVRAESGQTAATTTPPETARQFDLAPWLIGGGIALILAALVVWLLRRGSAATSPKTPSKESSKEPSRRYDSAALAAGMPTFMQAASTDVADGQGEVATGAPPEEASIIDVAPEADNAVANPSESDDVATTPDAELEKPSAAPTWHDGGAPRQAEPARASSGNLVSRDNIALAKSYIDLGDDQAARELLREAMNDSDPAARHEATRLLRSLD